MKTMRNKMFLRRALGISAVISLLTAPAARCSRQDDSILSLPVASYEVENTTMEEALRVLRATNPSRIVIGLEKVAHRSYEKQKTLSVSISNSTVGEVLDTLCKQDPRYAYETVQGLLVHVYPRNGQSDPPGLLSIRISKFSIDAKMAPAAVIGRISELAPELSSFLTRKRTEFYARRGIVPGSPGSNMTGNMDPEIHLDLHNLTVREVLNAVVLYSLQLNKQLPPDWTGNKIPPTSWIYDFTVDPEAQTGIGGHPQWAAF